MFPQLFEKSLNIINVTLSIIFDINQDVIQVNNYETNKFFSQDLIDIIFEAS